MAVAVLDYVNISDKYSKL